MTDAISTLFNFDRSLLEVLHAGDAVTDGGLAATPQLDPAQGGCPSQLDALIGRTLDERLSDALAPVVSDRAILRPGRFHDLVASALATFAGSDVAAWRAAVPVLEAALQLRDDAALQRFAVLAG